MIDGSSHELTFVATQQRCSRFAVNFTPTYDDFRRKKYRTIPTITTTTIATGTIEKPREDWIGVTVGDGMDSDCRRNEDAAETGVGATGIAPEVRATGEGPTIKLMTPRPLMDAWTGGFRRPSQTSIAAFKVPVNTCFLSGNAS